MGEVFIGLLPMGRVKSKLLRTSKTCKSDLDNKYRKINEINDYENGMSRLTCKSIGFPIHEANQLSRETVN